MHPKKMLFSMQNITCEVAYNWLLSNRLRLNNDSAGSHIKEEGKLNMYTTCVWLLLDLEGWLFARCLLFLLCSFHLFCLYRYECGLSCKLPLASFGIITNSGRIRNRRLYSDGLHQCIRRNVIFRIFHACYVKTIQETDKLLLCLTPFFPKD